MKLALASIAARCAVGLFVSVGLIAPHAAFALLIGIGGAAFASCALWSFAHINSSLWDAAQTRWRLWPPIRGDELRDAAPGPGYGCRSSPMPMPRTRHGSSGSAVNSGRRRW